MRTLEELDKAVAALEKKLKESKPRLHSFHQSPYYNIIEFTKALDDWSIDDIKHFHEAAENYSNKGNKYLNWIKAVKNWKDKRDKENGVFNEKPGITKY